MNNYHDNGGIIFSDIHCSDINSLWRSQCPTKMRQFFVFFFFLPMIPPWRMKWYDHQMEVFVSREQVEVSPALTGFSYIHITHLRLSFYSGPNEQKSPSNWSNSKIKFFTFSYYMFQTIYTDAWKHCLIFLMVNTQVIIQDIEYSHYSGLLSILLKCQTLWIMFFFFCCSAYKFLIRPNIISI